MAVLSLFFIFASLSGLVFVQSAGALIHESRALTSAPLLASLASAHFMLQDRLLLADLRGTSLFYFVKLSLKLTVSVSIQG